MDDKVFCPCDAKFRFQTEPVNGRMAAPALCPVCGGDATELANAVIAEQLNATPEAETAPRGSGAIRVAQTSAPPETLPAPATTEEVARCPKHLTELAVAQCFVCGKAICGKCMEQFGYLCSSYCKGQAEARHLDVPVFEGQIFRKHKAEGRTHN